MAAVVPEVIIPEIVLPHKYHAQQTGYTCGPSTALVTLSTFGINVTERDMAIACKTTVDGTNDVSYVTKVVGQRSGTPYSNFYIPGNAATQAQKDTFWNQCVNSLYFHRRGMPINVWVPAWGLPNYPGTLIMHYFAAVGIRYNQKQIYISDSARFNGMEHFWVNADRLADLITPKGYGAVTANADTTPFPAPDPFWNSMTPTQRAEAANNFRQLGPS